MTCFGLNVGIFSVLLFSLITASADVTLADSAQDFPAGSGQGSSPTEMQVTSPNVTQNLASGLTSHRLARELRSSQVRVKAYSLIEKLATGGIFYENKTFIPLAVRAFFPDRAPITVSPEIVLFRILLFFLAGSHYELIQDSDLPPDLLEFVKDPRLSYEVFRILSLQGGESMDSLPYTCEISPAAIPHLPALNPVSVVAKMKRMDLVTLFMERGARW